MRRVSEIYGPGNQANPATRRAPEGSKVHGARAARDLNGTRRDSRRRDAAGRHQGNAGRASQSQNGPQGPRVRREVERGTRLFAPDVASQKAARFNPVSETGGSATVAASQK
jgi:hypothetical protein